MINPLLKHALRYAERGWPVLPLHTPQGDECSCQYQSCSSPAKHPRTEHGLKDASIDTAIIERWWRLWPESNIGIATGTASGIIVLDIDDLMALRRLESSKRKLPATATATTGKGVHYYLQHPGIPIRNSASKIMPKVDVRADGGYVVAPPSIHVSGARYRWSSPKGVGPAPCPEWLIAALTAKTDTPAEATREGDIAEGSRNATLFLLGCAMRRWGACQKTILVALQSDNQERCKPPLDDDCVFHAKVATHSMAKLPPIPCESCH